MASLKFHQLDEQQGQQRAVGRQHALAHEVHYRPQNPSTVSLSMARTAGTNVW